MNIFVLDRDTQTCAQYHNNKHVVKMVLESAQLLSTTMNLTGGAGPYRTTHKNHPCTKWVRNSRENYTWLCDLFDSLLVEYTFRYDKIHKCSAYAETFRQHTFSLPSVGLTPFVLAMPVIYHSNDAVQSYRQYYMAEKSHIANWGRRAIPYWWS